MHQRCSTALGKNILLLCFVVFLSGCFYYHAEKSAEVSSSTSLKKIGWWGLPGFHDDMDRASLLAVIEKNFDYLERLPADRLVNYGNVSFTVEEVKESYKHFIEIIKNAKDPSDLNYRIKKDFNVFSSVGSGSEKRVLFTGYYEPILKGNYEKTDVYSYPIYGKPDDLVEINLGNFKRKLGGNKIIARIENGTITPYYDRKAIDGSGSLSGRGLEVAWLSDPLDVFFLHIQGSGIIEMPDGSRINANYAAKNGRRYRSIGRLLIEEEKVPKEKMSMKAIRDYLKSHPEEIERVLFYNESYVFFRVVDEGPIGSTGVPLTAGRSIATDTRIFPKGGLAFINTEIPVTDEKGNVIKWKRISRFVISQDTGGAIKGPGRVDIFFGTGKEAGNQAGAMNRDGSLFFLIKKREKKSF